LCKTSWTLRRRLSVEHSAADAQRVLRRGVDYVPIVDPLTYQLVGIVSASDVNQTPLAHAAESTPRLPNSLN
jgi:hypothetical protein